MADTAGNSRYTRLLVVDDDTNQLRTLTLLLEGEGFDVVGCSTGTEAMEHLGGGDIGVAVVDLRLPDLSETDLLVQLAAFSDQVHVIIHTAYSSYETAKKAVNLGAFAYIEKCSDPRELVHYVHRAFRTRLENYAADLEDAGEFAKLMVAKAQAL